MAYMYCSADIEMFFTSTSTNMKELGTQVIDHVHHPFQDEEAVTYRQQVK